MFNALKYTHLLEPVGFRREQAEAQVQLVFDAIETEVATKSDLSESNFAEIKSNIAQFKSDIKVELAEMKTQLIFKLGAMIVGGFTVSTAIIRFLIKF